MTWPTGAGEPGNADGGISATSHRAEKQSGKRGPLQNGREKSMPVGSSRHEVVRPRASQKEKVRQGERYGNGEGPRKKLGSSHCTWTVSGECLFRRGRKALTLKRAGVRDRAPGTPRRTEPKKAQGGLTADHNS